LQAEIKMIVGLGNPGGEYERTRHNLGFRVIDLLTRRLSIALKKKKRFGAAVGSGEFEGRGVVLLKPLMYMNCSGGPVAKAMAFYKPALADLLVITDDMALEPGRIRIRASGSAGGHNGLADVIEKLASSDFSRLRIGIGSPPARDNEDSGRLEDNEIAWRDYVLDEPTPQELELLDPAMQQAQQAALCWVRAGVESAMNEYNN